MAGHIAFLGRQGTKAKSKFRPRIAVYNSNAVPLWEANDLPVSNHWSISISAEGDAFLGYGVDLQNLYFQRFRPNGSAAFAPRIVATAPKDMPLQLVSISARKDNSSVVGWNQSKSFFLRGFDPDGNQTFSPFETKGCEIVRVIANDASAAGFYWVPEANENSQLWSFLIDAKGKFTRKSTRFNDVGRQSWLARTCCTMLPDNSLAVLYYDRSLKAPNSVSLNLRRILANGKVGAMRTIQDKLKSAAIGRGDVSSLLSNDENSLVATYLSPDGKSRRLVTFDANLGTKSDIDISAYFPIDSRCRMALSRKGNRLFFLHEKKYKGGRFDSHISALDLNGQLVFKDILWDKFLPSEEAIADR